MSSRNSAVQVLDFKPETEQYLADVVAGLSCNTKYLPSKYLYDLRGSLLFDEICMLDEYYPTRTEVSIMQEFAGSMADQIGVGAMLVEFGSGSSQKTRLLLDRLKDPAAYVPVDISLDHLRNSAEALARDYPSIEILPVCADFTQELHLPESKRMPTHVAVYFPGSTIGNLREEAAKALLGRITKMVGQGGGLLIGIDLKKDVQVLEAAYNDQEGVTAEFNLNMLHRMNRELDAEIDVDQFRHEATYNQNPGRIEMHLVSQNDLTISVGDKEFRVTKGESICTEYSHKYTIGEFEDIAAKRGLILHQSWSDSCNKFAVLHLVAE